MVRSRLYRALKQSCRGCCSGAVSGQVLLITGSGKCHYVHGIGMFGFPYATAGFVAFAAECMLQGLPGRAAPSSCGCTSR
jgi:hypothetical protein